MGAHKFVIDRQAGAARAPRPGRQMRCGSAGQDDGLRIPAHPSVLAHCWLADPLCCQGGCPAWRSPVKVLVHVYSSGFQRGIGGIRPPVEIVEFARGHAPGHAVAAKRGMA